MLTVKSLLCIPLCLLVVGGVTPAKILNVPLEYSTIRSAVESASDGDTVVVDPGLYQENIRIVNKSIILTSNFLFDSSAISVSGTVIDGSRPLNPDFGSAVAVLGVQSSGTAVIGFTLRGGVGTFLGDKYAGGGLLIDNAPGTYAGHNVIMSNNATRGGGVAMYGSSVTLEANLIMQNFSTYGGGIELGDSPAVARRNAICQNDASIAGGGASISNSGNAVFSDNIVHQNSAAQGGAIAVNLSQPQVAFNNFWDNGTGFSGCDPAIGDTSCCLNFNGIPCDAFSNIFRHPNVTYQLGPTAFLIECSSDLIDAGSQWGLECPLGGVRTDIGPGEYQYAVGDLNADSEVDITDVVYLIDYVFLFAWTPCPRWSGDWNGDRRVNSIDLAQLIGYIFRSGHGPYCGDGY